MPPTAYDNAFASARFFAEDLDPLDVTKALLIPPDRQYRRTEPRLSRAKDGTVVEHAPHRNGHWSFTSKGRVTSKKLATHLVWLLDQLEARSEAVEALVARGVRADLFCYSSGRTSTPPSIPSSVRARADALGLEIQVDHYCHASGDEG